MDSPGVTHYPTPSSSRTVAHKLAKCGNSVSPGGGLSVVIPSVYGLAL